MTLRSFLKLVVALAALPLLLLGSCSAMIRVAEWRAASFCDRIQVGSDIAPAIARFEASVGKPGVRHWESATPEGAVHVFLFPFAFDDRASCQAWLGPDRRVTGKGTDSSYD